jgi:hypothetical protein
VTELTVPHFVYLAASSGEETIWAQMLVLIVLAVGGGIYAFIKTRPGSRRGRMGPVVTSHGIIGSGITRVSHFLQTVSKQIPSDKSIPLQNADENDAINQTSLINYQAPAVSEAVLQHNIRPGRGPAAKSPRRDLKNGMELLESSFLVKIIERPVDADGLDIEMQKLCFAELMRRRELAAISSEALKVYTLDKAGFYGKIIRRQAMEELFQRTSEKDS